MTVPVGVVLPKEAALPRAPAMDDVGAFGELVEDLGYDALWSSEGWGTDAFLSLAAAASRTESLRVGTSIVNVFTRTPAGLAMAAASLARIGNTQAVLGLGIGHPGLVEDLHGLPFEEPMTRMFETLTLTREFLGAGEEVAFDRKLFDVAGYPPLDADVPVYGAALGETNRRIVGRAADGWLPYNIPFPALSDRFETVATAAREAGRDPADITVAPYVPAVVSDDPAEARDELRYDIASYIGGFTDDSYKNAVTDRFPAATERIASAWRDGDEAAAADAVTDEMLADLGVAGTPEEARDQFRALLERPVVDRALVSVPHTTDWELGERTVRELAPAAL